jgi:Flp pilus assembly pilin Flp
MKKRLLKKRFTQSAGASLVEYSLLVALVASTCLASTQMLGFQIRQQFRMAFDGGTSYGGDFDPSLSTANGSSTAASTTDGSGK